MKTKNIIIKVDKISAKIVADVVAYNIDQLKKAEKDDPLKDNDYIIIALAGFLRAYENATEEED